MTSDGESDARSEYEDACDAVCAAIDAAKIFATHKRLTLFRSFAPHEIDELERGLMPADPSDAVQVPIGRLLAEGVFARLNCLQPIMDHLDLHRLVDAVPADLELTPAKARAAGPELLGVLLRISTVLEGAAGDELRTTLGGLVAEGLRAVRRAPSDSGSDGYAALTGARDAD